jgi:3-methyl-2-oxobutanoate hydroxymethyltransferase
MSRLSAADITARKRDGATALPIVVLTAYTAPMAHLLDAHTDIILVGDSLGMVLYGMENTRSVSLDMMIAHASAVVRGSKKSLVLVDMPFGTYEESPEQALRNARRLLDESGADALKLEGDAQLAPTVALLVQNNIPVMGHVGLLPQQVTSADGFKTQGKTDETAARILQDALALQEAGAFSVLMEAVTEPLARHITAQLRVPTIGIGASPACDGQVLVTDDMLGLSAGYIPRFVKRYGALASQVDDAVKHYAQEVRSRAFPSAEYCYPYTKPTL